jgi:U3 small nucleolar ribonucleoprotein protein IMP4
MLERRFRRERREYLERMRYEDKRVEARSRREALLNSYERDVVVPKELRERKADAPEIMDELVYAHERDEREDEYTNWIEPRILITTSRSPSASLVKFAKSLKFVFPNSTKINRGKHMIRELPKMAREHGYTDLLMVNEHKGRPASLILSHLPHGPTAYFSLHNVITGEEEKFFSGSVPGVVFENLTTSLGKRVQKILSALFPPLDEKKRPKKVLSFVNREDFILVRGSALSFTGGEIELKRVLPQFEMRLYEIRSGPLDVEYAEKEYVFRPYLNTARKRTYL